MTAADDLHYRTLLYRTRRRTRKKDGLTPEERIALNVFWRDGVKVPILARVFKVSRNTIYYSALTGQAESYPNTEANTAAETNDIVEAMGVEAARAQYVTERMQMALEAELEKEIERRARRR